MEVITIEPNVPSLEIPDWHALLQDAPPEKVKDVLRDAGQFVEAIERATTKARVALGRVLVVVRERKLHLEWGYDGWMSFIGDMPTIAFVAQRTAYEAIEMAESSAIQQLTPEQLSELPLTNARNLVKFERQSEDPVPAEILQQAIELRPRDFRREVSAEEGAAVRVWCRDKGGAEHLDRIMRVLQNATPEALKAFADFFESAELISWAGDGADSKIDAVLGYLATHIPKEIRQEGDERQRQIANGVSDAAWNSQRTSA